MTRQAPIIEGDARGSDKVRIFHARPLRVEQDLEGVGTRLELDSQNLNAWVLLVSISWCGFESLAIGGNKVKDGAFGRVENGDLHLLVVQCEVGGGSIESDSSIGVHAPVDVLGRGHFVLDEDLTTVVEHATTSLDGIRVEVGAGHVGGPECGGSIRNGENSAGSLRGFR